MPPLLVIVVSLTLWLIWTSAPQYRVASALPKDAVDDEIGFAWLGMGLVILAAPWVSVNVLPSALMSVMITQVFLFDRLALLEWIPPVRRVRRNRALLHLALVANHAEHKTLSKGFRLGNITEYIRAEIGATKFAGRMVFAVFVDGCKIAAVLAALMALAFGLGDVPEHGLGVLGLRILGQVGMALTLNLAFVLMCMLACLELTAVQMQHGTAPTATEIEAARNEILAIGPKEFSAWSWGSLAWRGLLIALVLAIGSLTHIVVTFGILRR